jgi:hypothetical protein
MRASSTGAIIDGAHLYAHFPDRQPAFTWFFRISFPGRLRYRRSQKIHAPGIAMRHIRHSEVIDRNAPELVDLFDHRIPPAKAAATPP